LDIVAKAFIRVVLPLPLAPQSMMQSPSQMSKEIPEQRILSP
jgi:hypothetical protein